MKKLFFTISFFATIVFNALSQGKIIIEPKPANIYIEQGDHKQVINFDFLVNNKSTDTLSLDKLTISVFDNQKQLLQSRFLDNNGTAPGILVLPNRTWNGEITHLVFNPFSQFEITTPIYSLEFEWTFSNTARKEFIVSSTIYPKKYVQKNNLQFPVKGRVLVYDAHDYHSHHRRFDYTFEPIKQLGLGTNFMRYAYDFMILNNENKQFKNKGANDQDYFGFGSPVYAIADGKVIYVSTNHKDNKKFDIPKLIENPLELYGNCVAIQHADKSVSIYGHLKENSVPVKQGDMVKARQELGQIGVSGSSFLPHLHFEMRTSILNTAEGLPSYFNNVFLREGKRKRKLITGFVETGNIIDAK